MFSTWFGLRNFRILGLGSKRDSRTKYSGCSCNQIIYIKLGRYSILFGNTSSRSSSNLVLYTRSGLGGKIFVFGSIQFNRGSIDSRLLQGAAPRVSGFFFKAVVQAVLLFRAETWVVTPRMGKALGGFQTQVVIRLTGRILWRTPDRRWRYTSAAAAREEAGLLTMEKYISRRKNTVAHYISKRSLLDLC